MTEKPRLKFEELKEHVRKTGLLPAELQEWVLEFIARAEAEAEAEAEKEEL